MKYTISQAAEKIHLSAHTLRYYGKEGLLPFVDRTESGNRLFKDSDLEWLSLIECFKTTGMPLKNIKHYIDLTREGDLTLKQREAIILEQKAAVEQQIAILQAALEKLNYKCWYYATAIAAGTEEIHLKALNEKSIARGDGPIMH